jgi:hypothetical protein
MWCGEVISPFFFYYKTVVWSAERLPRHAQAVYGPTAEELQPYIIVQYMLCPPHWSINLWPFLDETFISGRSPGLQQITHKTTQLTPVYNLIGLVIQQY